MDKVKFESTKAHQRYKTADGENVPGATTVLGILNKPALLAWAWGLGIKGEDFRKVKDKAADIGTIAHWLIELHLKGLEPDVSNFAPADLAKAENAVIKFMSWWDTNKFQFVASEQQYVSDKDGYGGTLDIIATVNGDLCLIDLKTSKGIYDEYWFQLAAYAELHNQNRLCAPFKRMIICRIGKEEDSNDFEIQEKQSLSWELDVFKKCLALYKALKTKNKGE
jgi:hypothetical protein